MLNKKAKYLLITSLDHEMMTDDFRNKQCVFNMNVGFQGFQTWCKSFCANTRKIAHISGGNVYGI